ncbi:hypothetical protein [Dokdonella sp.]|uniref:sialidase family protein n=1 Tax=Dokdonella sp. TaxID=2291710 RepID=UPI002C6202B4|nr:hypothetical protein [Dokdonella sp.]HPN79690.1 hypothetical protein [Dokdonella sp.]
MSRYPFGRVHVGGVLGALLGFALSGGAAAAAADVDAAAAKAAANAAPYVTAESCALLDDPGKARMMDGLLFFLAKACGRQADFIGQVESEQPYGLALPYLEPGTDVNVSNPTGDTGATRTQSETSIERNPVTGTLCAAYNDSFHGVTQAQGFSGFSRSTDGGLTWVDRGALSSSDSGDPSLVWRRQDGKFYYAALRSGGLGLFRSDDDCQTFVFVSQLASGNDDKEIMAIDNEPTSPFYGRIYIVWTDFGTGSRIHSIYSTNAGATWSTQLAISPAGESNQGAWPTIAPNGDVYVTWLKWMPPTGYPNGNIEVPILRSTDGGVSYTTLTPAMTNQINPRDAAATTSCSRPAIKGNIRLLPSPQIVFRNGYLHTVYAYDPDGFGTGDVIDVFYRRYNPGTSTWSAEVRINDDGTTRDQYQPTVSVGAAGQVTVGYYSRQLDPNNLSYDYYSRTSFDNGATWTQPSVRLTDTSSPVVLDTSLATCYHGDYDQQLQDEDGRAHYLWSDDRGGTPDVFTDRTLVGTNYLLVPVAGNVSVCAPDNANYLINVGQFQGFSELVTLAASGNPVGSSVSFGTNPVAPAGSSTVTVTTAGVAAGSSVIDITGTSTPGAIVQSTALGLSIATAAPPAPALSSPANNATIVPVRPTFTWSASSQGAQYILEVDNEPGFAPPLTYTATVTGTSHVPTSDLPSNATLYWRVRSSNICGTGPDASAFSFTTVPLPGDCPIGSTSTALYSTDFEGDNSAWTLGSGSSGPSNWAISAARPHGGTKSYLAQDVLSLSDQRLVSPAVALPVGQSPLSLIFWSDQTIESNGASCYDGGILEVSTDGGTTFTQVGAAAMLTDPYNGPIATTFQNPLSGLNAWCGDPQAYLRSVVDLTTLAGQTVRFRFRLGTDSSAGRVPHGWYIDDLVVQSCNAVPLPDVIFVDGFELPN